MGRLYCYGKSLMLLLYIQWLNVRDANVTVANWKLITSELPHIYSMCSECHLQGIAGLIIEVFTKLQDQSDDDDDDDDDGYNSVWIISQ